ncbi:MAG: DUF134 domain-containing protein [bacterium]
MPRPHNCRRVGAAPGATVYKPAGIRARELDWITLGLDELEALRLADRDGLHHEAAAMQMGISRPTFGRIVENARRKVAQALCAGSALAIAGGNVVTAGGWGRRRCRRMTAIGGLRNENSCRL